MAGWQASLLVPAPSTAMSDIPVPAALVEGRASIKRPPYFRSRLPIAALFGSLILSARFVSAAEPVSTAAELVSSNRLLIIAHRGDSRAAPENTIPAFRSAVRAGSDLVELDYVHTKEGVPVVIHDETLDRTTNARQLFGGEKIPVVSKTLGELRPLDAGSWFDPEFRGTRLPTLDESLDVIQEGSVTLIERKQGDPRTCVELLRKKGLLEKVVVQAFDWKFLAGMHALAPEIALGALGSDELGSETLTALEKTGATAVGWNHEKLNREVIARLHAAGFRVWAWTVDDPARARNLAEAGIDGIITDVPARVKALGLLRKGKE